MFLSPVIHDLRVLQVRAKHPTGNFILKEHHRKRRLTGTQSGQKKGAELFKTRLRGERYAETAGHSFNFSEAIG